MPFISDRLEKLAVANLTIIAGDFSRKMTTRIISLSLTKAKTLFMKNVAAQQR